MHNGKKFQIMGGVIELMSSKLAGFICYGSSFLAQNSSYSLTACVSCDEKSLREIRECKYRVRNEGFF